MLALALSVLTAAALPAVLACWNLLLLRRPLVDRGAAAGVSILIPARDEEVHIEDAVRAALVAHDGPVEILVGNDGSRDSTAARVAALAEADACVRLVTISAPGAGWCGKQNACQQLADRASADRLLFVDADVRLAPGSIGRMVAELERQAVDLISGVPAQRTPTVLEAAVVPLIHFLLYGYLPLIGMRWSRSPAFAAGCGQLMLVRRDAYRRAGGHAAIRGTRHDGLRLPRSFRAAGLRTGLVDAGELASCRMYETPGALWWGLAKNADEGMATPVAILPWTLLLGLGQVAPLPLLALGLWSGSLALAGAAGSGALLSFGTRALMARRFGQRPLGVLLHPFGVAYLIAVQWFALFRSILGRPLPWRGRLPADAEPAS